MRVKKPLSAKPEAAVIAKSSSKTPAAAGEPAAAGDKAKVEPSDTTNPADMYKYDASLCITKYGYAARLKRAECLHRFLCYMIYNYEGLSDDMYSVPFLIGHVNVQNCLLIIFQYQPISCGTLDRVFNGQSDFDIV